MILCSDLAANGAEYDAITSLRVAVRQKQNFNGWVGPFKFATKGYELKSKEDERKKTMCKLFIWILTLQKQLNFYV